MQPLVIGTYPPRVCGIATFTADVVNSLDGNPGVERPGVIAVVTDEQELEPDVVAAIGHDDRASYRAAGAVANDYDVVLLEHEFGIFGGPDGEMILDFIDTLSVPLVVSLHTVLRHPSENQARVLRRLCDRAASVMVFTATARRMVLEQGLARASKLRVVPHGAPAELYGLISSEDAKRRLGVEGRPTISTFGLLSSGKGIEVALEALVSVREYVPDVVYVIAGRTHPEIIRNEGESYRERLAAAVDELGLGDNVVFIDRFLDMNDLALLLSATDVFCTPYLHGEQIVSGALTFAIAAGRPAVSTPYRYAQDLLSDGAGHLVPFNETEPLADALTEMLTKPEVLAEAQDAARRAGASLSWPEVGRQTALVLRDAIELQQRRRGAARPRSSTPVAGLADGAPTTATTHLRAMVDDTGIFQHADGRVPALEHGYCVDDVARLLPIAHELSIGDPTWTADVVRALGFLRAASDGESAAMRNFLTWDRKWLDDPHPGDHVARTVWALAELVSAGCSPGLRGPAEKLLRQLAGGIEATEPTIRTAVYTALGLAAWGSARPASATATLQRLLQPIAGAWRGDNRWPWFEDRLT
ncbi:MAG TPA: glycosyltransferase, partial [Acidimicrobiales bacterium]|nr:glycosyltransferase [Acidimicrobiales bacterium]